MTHTKHINNGDGGLLATSDDAQGQASTRPITSFSYRNSLGSTIYVDTLANGDELVSEYNQHFQRAYVRLQATERCYADATQPDKAQPS